MAWRFRRSKPIGQYGRVNFTKRGIGFSVGVPGFRLSLGPDRRIRRTISLPGTGLYAVDIIGDLNKLLGRRR